MLRIPTVVAVAAALAMAIPATAQNEAALKSYFEGRRVTVRLDMPATADGVDVHADAKTAIEFPDYRNDLKRYGVAIHAGESALVTLVKVKKDLIEFQLGGGGYGTFGDDTSTSVHLPPAEKSEREKALEKRVKEEDNRERRREMERELDALRDRRERENRRIAMERERLEAIKREEVAERRLRGGSRFNLRYEDNVPAGVRPDELMFLLAEYVDFGETNALAGQVGQVGPVGPVGPVGNVHRGMLRADVERALGRPAQTTERREGALTVLTLVFIAGEQRITAEFVEDVLIRYTIVGR
jgi:hypothetical protein